MCTGRLRPVQKHGLPGWYDPQKAIPLAEKACELTGRRQPDPLTILARTYAAGGRNLDALRTANEALRIARAAGDEGLARQIEKSRAAYERATAEGKPGP